MSSVVALRPSIVLDTQQGLLLQIERRAGELGLQWSGLICRRPSKSGRAAGHATGQCMAFIHAEDAPRFHPQEDGMPACIFIGTCGVNLTDRSADAWQKWFAEHGQ